MTLFDTDVLVWAFRGNEKAVAEIGAAAERALSAVSYMELLRGARNAREATAIRKALAALSFRMLPVTESISDRAVALMEALALRNGLDPMDALVFSTALDGAHVLCSANHKHFKEVSDLRSKVFRP